MHTIGTLMHTETKSEGGVLAGESRRSEYIEGRTHSLNCLSELFA